MSSIITAWVTLESRGFRMKSSTLERLCMSEMVSEKFYINEYDDPTLFLNENTPYIFITDMMIGGEMSGWFWDELVEAFKETLGRYVAAVVWERGDSIDLLTVNDGKVETRNAYVILKVATQTGMAYYRRIDAQEI